MKIIEFWYISIFNAKMAMERGKKKVFKVSKKRCKVSLKPEQNRQKKKSPTKNG
jgi:hypothetical protein